MIHLLKYFMQYFKLVYEIFISFKATGGGGSEVNFEILRYVVELDLNFQMLLSLPKTKFPI